MSLRKLSDSFYFYRIKGGDFTPTFEHNDTIKITTINSNNILERGNLVLYEPKSCIFIEDKCSYFSRIIALPGDKVIIKDNHIEINGELYQEEYANWEHTIKMPLSNSALFIDNQYVLPKGKYLLLDDNRNWTTNDSRSFGLIDRNSIVGIYSETYMKSYPVIHASNRSFLDLDMK